MAHVQRELESQEVRESADSALNMRIKQQVQVNATKMKIY